jgi:hypothetical protein
MEPQGGKPAQSLLFFLHLSEKLEHRVKLLFIRVFWQMNTQFSWSAGRMRETGSSH